MNTYTKLKQGWGIKVIGNVSAGQTVQVTTKAGKLKSETIAKVIWSGQDKFNPANGTISLCTTAPKAYAPRRSGGGESWRGNGCSECRRLGDWCPRCHFDEFDN
jgi:hypothetical protein